MVKRASCGPVGPLSWSDRGRWKAAWPPLWAASETHTLQAPRHKDELAEHQERDWQATAIKKKEQRKKAAMRKTTFFFMPFQIMWAFYAKVIIDTLCSREEPLLSWSGDLRPPCHRSGAQTKDWRAIVYFFIKTAVLRNQQETNFRCRWESNKVLWVALPTSGFRVSSKQTPEQRVTMETTSNHQTEEKKQQEKKTPPGKR